MKKLFATRMAMLLSLCALTCACFGQDRHWNMSPRQTDDSTFLFETTMRAVRMHETLMDSSGHPYESVAWNTKHEFKKITETSMVPVIRDGKNVTMLMFRPLLVPGAPWIMAQGNYYQAARSGAPAEKYGQQAMHPLNVAGEEPKMLLMWKTTETSGKWIGLTRDEKAQRIYQCLDDGVGAQIGWLAYRTLTLRSGETVNLFMTKGMVSGSMWEGDVGDTTYREITDGKGTPVAKLAYRPLKLPDGTETVILMARKVNASTPWIGVRNGKVIRDAAE